MPSELSVDAAIVILLLPAIVTVLLGVRAMVLDLADDGLRQATQSHRRR
jgi:hypothetical protein